MRESKYDYHVIVAMIAIFFFSFFVQGVKPVYCTDGLYPVDPYANCRPGDLHHIEYPTSIIIAPLVAFVFFILKVFSRELRPVDRHFVKKKIKNFFVFAKKTVKEKWRNYVFLGFIYILFYIILYGSAISCWKSYDFC